MEQPTKLFRFEDMEVWQRAARLALTVGGVADELETLHRYRYAEQLRAAGISISNNIAEGSGSTSNSEFRNFLNYVRRSVFECASMLLVIQRDGLIKSQLRPLLVELNEVARMITSFSRSLN
jgi:four helix bundle protein